MNSPCCNKGVLRLGRAKLVCSECKKDVTIELVLIAQLEDYENKNQLNIN